VILCWKFGHPWLPEKFRTSISSISVQCCSRTGLESVRSGPVRVLTGPVRSRTDSRPIRSSIQGLANFRSSVQPVWSGSEPINTPNYWHNGRIRRLDWLEERWFLWRCQWRVITSIAIIFFTERLKGGVGVSLGPIYPLRNCLLHIETSDRFLLQTKVK